MRKQYSGSCHCGRTRFEITADIDHVRVCDCSICTRRGALIFRVPEEDFNLLTPLSDLSTYVWGSGTGKDYFCPVCGVLPFRKPSALTSKEKAAGKTAFNGWAINIRCLNGIDFTTLPVERIPGRLIEYP